MQIQLTGIEYVEYVNKQGRQIKGLNIYGTDVTTEASDLLGHKSFEAFISGFDGSDLELGEIYEVEFDVYKFGGRYQSKVVGLRKEE